jgi:quercetin dioxygenase-like cupin family protein
VDSPRVLNSARGGIDPPFFSRPLEAAMVTAMATIRRFEGEGGHRWQGIAVEPYAPNDARAGTRQVLIGPADGAANFALRYFELAPGTTSSLDSHAHDHGVYVLHGRGRVRLDAGEHAIGPGDVVYVAPHDRHAFAADGDTALGFLCVVPARR